MIRVRDDLIIIESVDEVVAKVRDDCFKATGRYFMARTKNAGKALMVSCPFHKRGEERTPSCGIRRTDGLFHCFTCKSIYSLPEAISHMFAKLDDGAFGERWLLNNCTIARIDDRSLEPMPRRERVVKKVSYVDEAELAEYRVYHDYMFKRGLTEELIEQFDIGFDPDFRLQKEDGSWSQKIPCLTFPVRDKTGGTLFVARRSVEGKLFHYPHDVEKPIYGIYELFRDCKIGMKDGKFHILKELGVVESILNATNSWKYGIPAIALLGTGTTEQYKIINRLPVETLYTGFDPDEAGDNATLKFYQNVKRTGIRTFDIPQNKDINDLSYDEYWGMPRLTPDKWKEKYIL